MYRASAMLRLSEPGEGSSSRERASNDFAPNQSKRNTLTG